MVNKLDLLTIITEQRYAYIFLECLIFPHGIELIIIGSRFGFLSLISEWYCLNGINTQEKGMNTIILLSALSKTDWSLWLCNGNWSRRRKALNSNQTCRRMSSVRLFLLKMHMTITLTTKTRLQYKTLSLISKRVSN